MNGLARNTSKKLNGTKFGVSPASTVLVKAIDFDATAFNKQLCNLLIDKVFGFI